MKNNLFTLLEIITDKTLALNPRRFILWNSRSEYSTGFLKGFTLIISVLAALHSFAQKPPAIEWDKTFGGSSNDVANSIIQTTDGGYAVCGYTSSKGAGDEDFWVIRLNQYGEKQWDVTFGGSDWDRANSIIQTTDGGYAVCGFTRSKGAGSHDFWVIRLNQYGEKQWDVTFGGSESDQAESIIQTTDGGYAVCGYTSSKDAGGEDFWVIRLNQYGEKQWDVTFGGSEMNVQTNFPVTSIIQTTNGGYAVCGTTESKGAGSSDFWVIRLNRYGEKQWEKTFGGSYSDGANSIIQTTNGGYAVCGSTSSKGAGRSDFWVIMLNKYGKKQWDVTFGGSKWDKATSIIQTTDGGYAVCGSTSSKGAGGEDFCVLRLNKYGEKQWDKTFGGSSWDEAYSIIQTTDGGYAVCGTTESKGAGRSDFWVIKLK
ncbi:MAG: hypothetical protein FVQ77_05845 [Cytophagales bacterium]|nr:hypothetical protein [Cytophagales bacterium]